MKFIPAITVVLILTGCTTDPPPTPTKPVVIQTQPVERPPFNPPAIDPYNPRPVEWTVITPENIDKVWEEMERTGKPVVLFAVTDQGYENISINNREALRVIVQQQRVIQGYREYYVRVR